MRRLIAFWGKRKAEKELRELDRLILCAMALASGSWPYEEDTVRLARHDEILALLEHKIELKRKIDRTMHSA